MIVLRTDRLQLRRLSFLDAAFILELVNEPSWLEFIGDRNVHDLPEACGYIGKSLDTYERDGFGLFAVELRENGTPVGLCGLMKRETLDDVDIGFALLSRYGGNGYAYEAAAATLAYGVHSLGLRRIVGICSPANHRSIKLLQKIGLQFERNIKHGERSVDAALYARNFDAPAAPKEERLGSA